MGKRSTSRDLLLLAAAIMAAGAMAFWLQDSEASGLRVVAAVLWTMAACLPPFWFPFFGLKDASFQLGVTAWRLGTSLLAVAFSRVLLEGERNYYLTALMACYFVALPLESWLLIRNARRKTGKAN